MNEIYHFKVFILCSGDVDHLHVKRIHLGYLQQQKAFWQCKTSYAMCE
jgi:hypothetical protein